MSYPHVERSRWYWARGCAALVLALLALAPWAGPVQAAPTFSVNSTLDEPDAFVGDAICSSTPSGQCTLRAAVQEGQAVNRAVVVPAGLYELTLGQLVVTQNLTLTGAGSGKTKLDGKLMSRIFDIGATGFAYIGDVTIQWGIGGQSVVVNTHYHGGAIHNAPYNHADPATRATAELRIQLLYLPTYSPNLNLIERFWKFLKRKVARNRYYTTFAEFRIAVQNVLNNFVAYRDDLTALMTERFQLFTTP